MGKKGTWAATHTLQLCTLVLAVQSSGEEGSLAWGVLLPGVYATGNRLAGA